MKLPVKRIRWFVLLVAVILGSSQGMAQEQSHGDQAVAVKPEAPPKTPELTDIVPLAAELAGRLATLQSKIADGLDVSEVEPRHKGIQANLKAHTEELQRLKDLTGSKYNKLLELRESVKRDRERFDRINEPIRQEIRQLGTWREKWLVEKRSWNEWENSLVKEQGLHQLQSTFVKANDTIDTALNLVTPHLDSMLKVQQRGGRIDTELEVLLAEVDGLIGKKRLSTLIDESPPMISLQFLSQFRGGELWFHVKRGLTEISWPGSRFFAQHGWVIFLKGFLSLFVIIAVYRNRETLSQSEHWRFIAVRPVSAGLFSGSMTALVIYAYQGVPAVWHLSNSIVAGFSFARLTGALIEASWKKHFVYVIVTVLIGNRLMEVFNFPLPILRLYIGVAALVSLFFCLLWARESLRGKESGLYVWSFRSGAFLLGVIVISQVWGKRAVASHLFVSLITSIATVLVFMLFMYMIRGGLEWIFRTSLLRRTSKLYQDADVLVQRGGRFIEIAMWGLFLLPAFLVIWGVYDSMKAAMKGLLTLGFNLGAQRISVGLMILAAGLVYGSFLVSWLLQNLLMDNVLRRRGVETGVQVSIKRLIHYFLIFLGFVLALAALGLEITKLTIMLSALGVGIGFGLQGVVNNFVSGLILLFERPVRVGDYIELGGNWSEIKKIGLRATTVQTFDQAEVIIPNGDLISNQVTNWTLSNRRARIIIPVGVAYGSDVPLVIETLMACADAHELVVKTPAPQVLFQSFGESSLDFELRVWILDVDYRLTTQSELHQEIDRRFREAGIEIAFPQRDLHLRTVDESVVLRTPETS